MEKQIKTLPDLRFPEFKDEWKEKKLGDFISEYKGKSTENNQHIVLTSSNKGLMKQSDYFGENRITERENLGFNIIPAGFITYRSRSDDRKFTFNINDLGITGIISTYYPVFSIKNGSNNFFVEYFNYRKHYLGRFSVGTSQQVLSLNDLRSIKLIVPSAAEQQKVAAFLTAVDEKIQQLARKKDLLEQYKKGVMQKIFNQEIRFKDDKGNDFADWEEKPLGKVCKIYDGTHMTPDYKESGIPFYSVEHITADNFLQTKFIAEEVFEQENKRVKLEKGNILMTRIGDIGTSKYISWDVKASFYVSLALIKQSKLINSLYLNQYIATNDFQKELWKRTIHVAFPKKINLGEIGNCLVKIPEAIEQQKIANFLSAIDDKTNLVNQQLDKTKEYKKGLLQKMFV